MNAYVLRMKILSRVGLSLALVAALNGCAQKAAAPYPNTNLAQKSAAAQYPNGQAANNQNVGGSRLDRQPWPAGMGQPVTGGVAGGGVAGGAVVGSQNGISSTLPGGPASGLPPSNLPVQRTQNAMNATKAKVAILLPLTGRNAALGQAMLNAAQQAVFDVAGPNFELMPRDTGDSDSGAETAARDALASGAQLLIGPLFAAQIPAVRSVAQAANINMLSLSTDTSLAAPGVYVMGFAPAPQVDRVTAYATAHGLRRFAAFVPDNAYGQLVGQEFQTAVARNGGTVVAYQTYSPEHGDLDAQMRTLLGYRNQIDALFLPEGGSDLARVNAQLVAAGVDGHTLRLLGTGLWDVPSLGAQDSALIGGLYAASDVAGRRNFVTAYATAYGQEPPRLATLAYDGTALAAMLARRNAPFDQASLTNPNGFAGVDGIFRLTSQGLAERGLAVNEVAADGPHIVEGAPSTFINAGY
jgi:ABC-type branched-subunit amino acid transport system substrate-binding protein